MTEHDDVEHEIDFVGLLAGDLSREETVAAALHLRDCVMCAQELADLVVAHCSLRSSLRVSRLLEEGDGMMAESLQDTAAGSMPPLPPLIATMPEVGLDQKPAQPGVFRSRRRAWLVVAAVILMLAVAGSVIALSAGSGPRGSTQVASAALEPIEAPTSASGSVAVYADGTTRSLSVQTHRLPDPSSQSFYEVWLLNPVTRKMLPMGVLSPSGQGSYSVAAGIMAGYSAVDVSLQVNDGDPAHSQTSVLRAQL